MDPREGRTSQGRLYLQRVDIGGPVVVGGEVIYQIALRKGEPILLSERAPDCIFWAWVCERA